MSKGQMDAKAQGRVWPRWPEKEAQLARQREGEHVSCRGQSKDGHSESLGEARCLSGWRGRGKLGVGSEHIALLSPKGASGVLAGVTGCDLSLEVFPWLWVGSGLERAGLTVTSVGGFATASGQLRTAGTQ